MAHGLHMQARNRSFVLVLGMAGMAGAQTAVDAPDAKPWRWADQSHSPWQAWHTDTARQAQLYAEAASAMQKAVGIELPGPVDVVLTPSSTFKFVSMEVGAKDGSLGLDLSVSRALEILSLGMHEQAGDAPMDDAAHDGGTIAASRGCYSPTHVKRMLFVDPHCDESHAAAALRHEL